MLNQLFKKLLRLKNKQKLTNKFLDVELEQNKINTGIEKYKNVEEITDIFDKIKNEPEVIPDIRNIF